MKVVVACPHSEISGGTKVVLNVAEGLAKSGIDTTVAFLKLKSNLTWFNNGKYSFNVIEANPFNKYTLPDSDILLNFLDGQVYAPINTKRHVLFLQGFGTQNRQTEINNLLYKYDAVIATSKWLADIALRAGHEKVYIVPPGIDPIFSPMKKPEDGIVRVGSLYHASPEKNFALFVNSYNKFAKKWEKAHAIILSSRLPKNTELLDILTTRYSIYVNPEQSMLPQIYSMCDLWVAPSLSEGFGLCPLEAMACGTPAVVAKSFGLDEIVTHNKHCMYVPPNKDAMFSAMNAAFSDGTTNTRLKKYGLALANSFTWKNCIKQFVAVLKDIV